MEQYSLNIGMRAPNFTAATTFGQINLSDYRGSWLVFFSHPSDFNPVSTTEFLSFAQAADRFNELNTQLLGLSIDSNPSHLDWVRSIYLSTGVHIPFPVIADRIGEVARLYGMIAPNVDETSTARSVYIIDPGQVIRAIFIYPKTNGRNVGEILRLVAALQYSDEEGLETPADWMPGQPGLAPAPSTYHELLERYEDKAGMSCIDWFWCNKD